MKNHKKSVNFLIFCFFISIFVSLYVHKKLDEIDSNIKNIEINKLKVDFDLAFLSYTNPLQGLVSGIHLSKLNFDAKEFRKASESRDFYKNFEGSLGVGFIRKLKYTEIEAYSKKIAPIKRLDSSKMSEFLYVIEAIEPVENNRQAVGLVISDEENRLTAAKEAMLTGKPAITLPIQLVQSKANEPGFLLMLPLYSSSAIPSTPIEREKALIGWAYSPIRLNPLKIHIEKQNPNFKIDSISIFDQNNKLQKISNLNADSIINPTDEININSVINKNWVLKTEYNNPTLISAKNKAIILFAICILLSLIVFFFIKRYEEKDYFKSKLIFETNLKVEEATKELSDQKKFLQKTINNIPAQVSYWNSDLINQLANKAYYEAYKVNGKQIQGMHAKELLGDIFDTNYSKIQSALNGNCEVFERTLNRDTNEVIYQVHFIPDLVNSKVMGIFSIIYDISELKQLQRKEKEQQALLYSKSRLSLLGEMASGIAHEINNPLAIIKAHSRNALKKLQMLNLETQGENYISLENNLQTIDRTVDRVANIIKGMRSVSRDSTNDPKEKSLIEEIANNILNLNKEKFKLKNIEFEIIQNTNVEYITCNKVQIEQVLLNLLSNSIYAVEKLSKKWIKLIISEEENCLVLRLIDSGHGISQEILDKLFVPFFTTKPTGQGTGIGLNISKNLIENHNGKFYYELFDGHTSFVIALPILEPVKLAS